MKMDHEPLAAARSHRHLLDHHQLQMKIRGHLVEVLEEHVGLQWLMQMDLELPDQVRLHGPRQLMKMDLDGLVCGLGHPQCQS